MHTIVGKILSHCSLVGKIKDKLVSIPHTSKKGGRMLTSTTLVQSIYLSFLWEMDNIRGWDSRMSISISLLYYHKL